MSTRALRKLLELKEEERKQEQERKVQKKKKGGSHRKAINVFQALENHDDEDEEEAPIVEDVYDLAPVHEQSESPESPQVVHPKQPEEAARPEVKPAMSKKAARKQKKHAAAAEELDEEEAAKRREEEAAELDAMLEKLAEVVPPSAADTTPTSGGASRRGPVDRPSLLHVQPQLLNWNAEFGRRFGGAPVAVGRKDKEDEEEDDKQAKKKGRGIRMMMASRRGHTTGPRRSPMLSIPIDPAWPGYFNPGISMELLHTGVESTWDLPRPRAPTGEEEEEDATPAPPPLPLATTPSADVLEGGLFVHPTGCRPVRVDVPVGHYQYVYTAEYHASTIEFERVLESHSLDALAMFVEENPWHVGGLLQLNSALALIGQHEQAQQYLHRALFVLETAMHTSFTLAGPARCRLHYVAEQVHRALRPPTDLAQGTGHLAGLPTPQQQPDDAAGDEADEATMEQDALQLSVLPTSVTDGANQALHVGLFRHMMALSRMGCPRAALEVAKVLLGLDPEDPLMVRLCIDTYALRSGQEQWLLQYLSESLPPVPSPSTATSTSTAATTTSTSTTSTSPSAGPSQADDFYAPAAPFFRLPARGTIHTDVPLLLPNMALGAALAQWQLEGGETAVRVAALMSRSDGLLQQALLLFPALLPGLVNRLHGALFPESAGPATRDEGKRWMEKSLVGHSRGAAVPVPVESASLGHLMAITIERHWALWRDQGHQNWLRANAQRAGDPASGWLAQLRGQCYLISGTNDFTDLTLEEYAETSTAVLPAQDPLLDGFLHNDARGVRIAFPAAADDQHRLAPVWGGLAGLPPIIQHYGNLNVARFFQRWERPLMAGEQLIWGPYRRRRQTQEDVGEGAYQGGGVGIIWGAARATRWVWIFVKSLLPNMQF
ncbi:putative Transcriptional repressor TCF25 [Paratrimastix pyriformis]|uniref:Transcriptional repressor TCF25 n=1 Tax=Paratrimastix pyriformis TaxID=342808 RepID=A0ABQ8UMW5_9EUKA|nr:putative Transcriptional repressor TCF25 [Paratrimastix pyriformis]